MSKKAYIKDNGRLGFRAEGLQEEVQETELSLVGHVVSGLATRTCDSLVAIGEKGIAGAKLIADGILFIRDGCKFVLDGLKPSAKEVGGLAAHTGQVLAENAVNIANATVVPVCQFFQVDKIAKEVVLYVNDTVVAGTLEFARASAKFPANVGGAVNDTIATVARSVVGTAHDAPDREAVLDILGEQLAQDPQKMKGVRTGIVAIPARMTQEITDFIAACKRILENPKTVFSEGITFIQEHLESIKESLGADNDLYNKLQALFFEIFVVMYFASKVLMFVHPLFYLMPNLIYALPVVNGLGHYTAGAVSESLDSELNFKLNKIRALLARLANKISSLDAATRVELLSDFFEGQRLHLNETNSPQADFETAVANIIDNAFDLDEDDKCTEDNQEACEFSVKYSKLQKELENLLWFLNFDQQEKIETVDGDVRAIAPAKVFKKLAKKINKLPFDQAMAVWNLFKPKGYEQEDPKNSHEVFQALVAEVLKHWKGKNFDALEKEVENVFCGIKHVKTIS
jgi:ubiquinone biosynthesis protein UbiJ